MVNACLVCDLKTQSQTLRLSAPVPGQRIAEEAQPFEVNRSGLSRFYCKPSSKAYLHVQSIRAIHLKWITLALIPCVGFLAETFKRADGKLKIVVERV